MDGNGSNVQHSSAYRAAAERVLGCCLADPAQIPLVAERLPGPLVWPSPLAPAWQAVLDLTNDGQVVTPETVADRSGVDVTLLTALMIGEKGTPERDLDACVEIVLRRGKNVARMMVGRRLARGDLDGAGAMAALEAIDLYGYTAKKTDAATLGKQFLESLDKPAPPANRTDLGPLDTALWEMPTGESTVIAARYKGWKTRTARNLVLAAAARGAKAVMVLAEGSAPTFTADCVAMIANQIIIARGQWDAAWNEHKLSGHYLLRARGAWLHNAQQKAVIMEAIAIWKTLPVEVLDHSDGSDDPDAVLARVRRLAHSGATLMCLDYIQDMSFPGRNVYEQMVAAKEWLRRITSTGVHAVLLSQKNEEAIRAGGRNAGVKGGGDLPSEADYLLAPEYDEDVAPGLLKLALPMSRHQKAMTMTYHIEEASGLFTAYEFMQKNGTFAERPVYVIPPERFTNSQEDLLI